MKAVYYEGFGPARDVLTHGDMPDPIPAAGEVVVRLQATGVNPSDVKSRGGVSLATAMPFPRIIPHSDGAGVIEAVGAGVDTARVGERVWIWNAQWQRAFGTAAELLAIPSEHAVRLPDTTSFDEGACFGIPAMTAWYALYRDGPIDGQTVLVTGGAGTVGRYACQMAALGGARVITTVSSAEKAAHAGAEEWVNYRDTDVTQAVMDMTDGAGVDRIVDVDFGANQAASVPLIKPRGVIAAYASAAVREPALNFYPLMFKNVTLHMLIVYQLDAATRRLGEAQLTDWLEAGKLSHAVVPGGSLADMAHAHEMVEAGEKLGTVVVEV
ncbi:NADPH:quinone reductase [Aliiroseovarius subalbicans]|uniref:NADPH:quinone reductase n=1 Tax=Aliiroseovarius subalbicans TaxID=2925840 RepID=UPI001F585C8A|nr:NADPH:quinone reductase [Aliiroseovarius subalbicans]MCI2399725.1 NADPH:quinone reductase [Aliiroseovarius subalbicans]